MRHRAAVLVYPPKIILCFDKSAFGLTLSPQARATHQHQYANDENPFHTLEVFVVATAGVATMCLHKRGEKDCVATFPLSKKMFDRPNSRRPTIVPQWIIVREPVRPVWVAHYL